MSSASPQTAPVGATALHAMTVRETMARGDKRNERRSPQTPSSPPLSGPDRSDRAAWIRVMLSDPHSRNP